MFYSRWTQLAGFQRTRGILRTLATALREAEKWDVSPLIGPAALLAAPGAPQVSEAVRELAGVASAEGSGAEGNRTDWAPLLEAELARARQIQDEMPALRGGREAEQAVIAVFLHSQPIGHKAYTPELVRLTGSCAPDGIELLGWEEVHAQLTGHEVDAVQAERLRRRLQEARGRVPETVRQAYAVVVTVNERNAVHAFKLAASSRPLFTEIKNDDRSRIKETPVDAGRCCPTDPTSCGARVRMPGW